MIRKVLSFCHKLKLLDHNLFGTWCGKRLIFHIQIIWSNRIHSFKYLKVHDIWMQRYRDYKIRVCCKESIPLFTILLQISVLNINYIFLFRPSYFYSFFNGRVNKHFWWYNWFRVKYFWMRRNNDNVI